MSAAWELQLFYDGECPLCAREIRFLAGRDRAGRIDFVDIAAPDFSAAAYALDPHAIVARIHGRLPDGTVVEGLEVFRRAYAAVGLGWLVLILGALLWHQHS